MLNETSKLEHKQADTPIKTNQKLRKANDPIAVDRGSYQRLVCRLIYLSHTRPDIAHAVSVVSQHIHDPKEVHLQAVYRILQYLKAMPGKGILFKKGKGFTLEMLTTQGQLSIEDRHLVTVLSWRKSGNVEM